MAVIAVGDVTTQMRKFLNANATGADLHKVMQATLALQCGLPASKDMTTLWRKFIAK